MNRGTMPETDQAARWVARMDAGNWQAKEEAALQAWLDGLLLPLKQAQAWDETALADLHNLREFLWPLLAGALDVPDPAQRERLVVPLRKTLRRLP